MILIIKQNCQYFVTIFVSFGVYLFHLGELKQVTVNIPQSTRVFIVSCLTITSWECFLELDTQCISADQQESLANITDTREFVFLESLKDGTAKTTLESDRDTCKLDTKINTVLIDNKHRTETAITSR